MKTILTLLTALTFIAGCASAPKLIPIIDASLQGAQGVTAAGKTLSEAEGNLVACYVTSSFLTAFGTAQSSVKGWAGEDAAGVIPSVDIDLSSCLALQEKPLEPVLEAKAVILVDALASGILPAIESIVLSIMEGQEASCQEKAVAQAVFTYAQAVKYPLVEELTAPDGKISLPEIALAACP